MHLVLISPEIDHPDEGSVVDALFAAGLERYHLRKPNGSVAELQRTIERIPAKWHPRIVLHQHHELVGKYGLGGRHWKDDATAVQACCDGGGVPSPCETQQTPSPAEWGHAAQKSFGLGRRLADAPAGFTSRSCHDLTTLRACLGVFDSVFFGPVFPSISKPGYGPLQHRSGEPRSGERERADGHGFAHAPRYDDVAQALAARTGPERRTIVLALGGINAFTSGVAMRLGFDGVAVLGAVWQAPDPIAAFAAIRAALQAAASAGEIAVARDGAGAPTRPSSPVGGVASPPIH
jgi:thiamine-phosphate pyrophosphorylase